eukprot:gene5040-5148_t
MPTLSSSCVHLQLLAAAVLAQNVPEPAVEAMAVASVEANIAAAPLPKKNVPQIVRLAFHDCVGGCDGCLNLANPDNAGLGPIVSELEAIYSDTSSPIGVQMSRADFWALAGVVAARIGARNSNQFDGVLPPLQLVYGRRDCATSPTTTDVEGLPNAHGDFAEVMRVFRDDMGMTQRQ